MTETNHVPLNFIPWREPMQLLADREPYISPARKRESDSDYKKRCKEAKSWPSGSIGLLVRIKDANPGSMTLVLAMVEPDDQGRPTTITSQVVYAPASMIARLPLQVRQRLQARLQECNDASYASLSTPTTLPSAGTTDLSTL